MKKLVVAAFCSMTLLAACGGSSSTASSKGSAAFCNNVKAVGSLSKGTADAMAMKPADSKKDFEALAGKITALKAGAPSGLNVAIDTVAARFTLEATLESMMAADPKGGKDETKMLADHKTADDAAIATLIAAAKTSCNVDIG